MINTSKIIRTVMIFSNRNMYLSVNITTWKEERFGVCSLPFMRFSSSTRFASSSSSNSSSCRLGGKATLTTRTRMRSAKRRNLAAMRMDTTMDAALMPYLDSIESKALVGR